MSRLKLLTLAAASTVLVSSISAHGSPYAAAVVSYNPGVGYIPGYTNTYTVLGQPSAADSYGDATDPFDSAWQTNQILSIGAGGWLTVEFDHPLVHYPEGNRDFIIFGNSFFDVPNYTNAFDLWYTDGTCENDDGQTEISVSRDGTNFYTLNPRQAPLADYLFPTDGSGDFRIPVSSGLTTNNFAGLTLAQIRLLYNGSAGGASYDTAWAEDTNGSPVFLPDIRYLRVDVLTNHAQIAGFAAVEGTILMEDFSNSPPADGWQTFGTASLFAWDATSHDLQVTWDSRQPNSYFYHPLGTVMTSNDPFSLSFDIQLSDAGTNADGEYQFELAIGFLNLAQAENIHFLRGTGDNATNLAEFNYFPADDQGDPNSLDATLIDANGDYFFAYDDEPLAFGAPYHVIINHPAGTTVMTGTILNQGQAYASLSQVYSEGTLADFRLDTVAIMSYSDRDAFGGSILAHGTVKNFFVTGPPPPVTYLSSSITNSIWQAQFWSRTNWTYTLQISPDLQNWSPVASASTSTNGLMTLQDTNLPSQSRFYRVSATPQ